MTELWSSVNGGDGDASGFEEFLHADNAVATNEDLTDKAIIAAVTGAEDDSSDDEEEPETHADVQAAGDLVKTSTPDSLSDYMPVLSDSVLASASCASPLKVVEEVEEEVAVEEESQAPVTSKVTKQGGSAGVDAERLLDDSAQAERVHHLENMLLEQTRYLDHQFRRIDRNMIHMHVQLTMMQHSCMVCTKLFFFIVSTNFEKCECDVGL
ncbi:hypothetical protein HPB52_023218 [Rhipicephalus sanguineus]|uniref:Uncharacterized protein n=1 Tax=Rhipicephalus sanguineus TaxID=34632 RepID=A0A9D4T6W1_RHISA|nr:hypothetical protein HPB52_023218 [Rhipicephalus sanguineus]